MKILKQFVVISTNFSFPKRANSPHPSYGAPSPRGEGFEQQLMHIARSIQGIKKGFPLVGKLAAEQADEGKIY